LGVLLKEKEARREVYSVEKEELRKEANKTIDLAEFIIELARKKVFGNSH